MGYVACLGQIPEETAHVLQNLVSANGLTGISALIKTILYHMLLDTTLQSTWFEYSAM